MNDHPDRPQVALYTSADLVAALREAGAERDRLEAVSQTAVLNAAAQHLHAALLPAVYDDLGHKAAEGVKRAASELRRLAAEAHQQETARHHVAVPAGAVCKCPGDCGHRPGAQGQQQPDTETYTPAEGPARIDRLRPDFFECASIEEIDSQIRQAQTQQRAWADREQTLGILRQARAKQMELGEWPAAVQTGAECQS